MAPLDDIALLREYAAQKSEPAFAQLVSRRVAFVYSAALRQVGDPADAEEITQAVFLILAQKAGRLTDQTNLTGWLFKTTRFTALAHRRAAIKRRQREQEAQMQSELQSATADPAWEQMSPLLDEALAKLGEKDRQAVLLRYIEKRRLSEVGSALGTGEDGARKRVCRALEKLRQFFSKRGVLVTTAAIGAALSANAVQAAPAALAISIGATVVQGSAAAASTLTLAKGAMQLMTWVKIKTAACLGGAAIVAMTATTVVVNQVVAQTGRPAPSSLAGTPAVAADPSGIDDSVWERPTDLAALPPVIIVRPTHFAAPTSPEPAGFIRSTSGTFSSRGGANGTGGSATFSARYGEISAMTFNGKLMMLAKASPFARLLQRAYEVDVNRSSFYPLASQKLMVLSPEDCGKRYDVLMNVPNGSAAQLAEAIKDQVGYVGHYEDIETNVLLLTMKRTGAPGLKAVLNGGNAAGRVGNTSAGGARSGGAGGGGGFSGNSGPSMEVDGHANMGGGSAGGGGSRNGRSYQNVSPPNVLSFDNRRAGYHNIIFTNQPISHLVTDLDVYRFVSGPAGDPVRGDATPTLFIPVVVDRTGLTGTYTVFLEWARSATPDAEAQAIQTALLDQLGLELVPARATVKMLVVDKVK